VGVIEAVGMGVNDGARVHVGIAVPVAAGLGASVGANAEIVGNPLEGDSAMPVAGGVLVALATGVAEGDAVITHVVPGTTVALGDGIRDSVGAAVPGAAVPGAGHPSATNTVSALVAPFKGVAVADVRPWRARTPPIAAPNTIHRHSPNPINPISIRVRDL
jgi:hypothetical protein